MSRRRRILNYSLLGVAGVSSLFYAKDEFEKSTKPFTKILKRKKIVVLGSGWGALSFIQQLDDKLVDLTVISPRSFFFYTPLLAGSATGTVAHNSIMEPIRWHTSRFGSNSFLMAECKSVNFKEGKIFCIGDGGHRLDVEYDQLVIAIGAEPATFNIPGVKEHAVFMKEVENGLQVQQRILHQLEYASALMTTTPDDPEIDRALHWVIVGGGPTGVELTAELSDFVNADVKKYFPHLFNRIHITLVEATDKILGTFTSEISAYAEKSLIEGRASVRCNAMVTSVTENEVCLKEKITSNSHPAVSTSAITPPRDTTSALQYSNSKIPYGMLVWAGGIAARPVTRNIVAATENSLQIPDRGLDFVRGIAVDDKFRVRGQPECANLDGRGERCVFAIGDCALSGCPPTAQTAYQQGKYLGTMFQNTLFDRQKIDEYESFRLINYGALAYVGASKGVAELKTLLWDNHPSRDATAKRTSPSSASTAVAVDTDKSKETGDGTVVVEGSHAFALWRSLYFSKLLSNRNKCQVVFDWIKTSVFGRDIASPYCLETSRNESENLADKKK